MHFVKHHLILGTFGFYDYSHKERGAKIEENIKELDTEQDLKFNTFALRLKFLPLHLILVSAAPAVKVDKILVKICALSCATLTQLSCQLVIAALPAAVVSSSSV